MRKMSRQVLLLTLGAVIIFILAGVLFFVPRPDKGLEEKSPQPTASQAKNELPNPASANCVEKGGNLTIKKRPDGGEYGVCDFGDNMLCEEWALFRGNCPEGGIKVTGYDSEAQIYCAITGGQTLAEPNTNCTLIDGNVCPVEEYYVGTCPL